VPDVPIHASCLLRPRPRAAPVFIDRPPANQSVTSRARVQKAPSAAVPCLQPHGARAQLLGPSQCGSHLTATPAPTRCLATAYPLPLHQQRYSCRCVLTTVILVTLARPLPAGTRCLTVAAAGRESGALGSVVHRGRARSRGVGYKDGMCCLAGLTPHHQSVIRRTPSFSFIFLCICVSFESVVPNHISHRPPSHTSIAASLRLSSITVGAFGSSTHTSHIPSPFHHP